MLTAVLTRRYEFRALHHLTKEAHHCHSVHGHNYHLEVSVEGAIDPRSGLLINRQQLDETVNKKILEKWDRVDLNRFTEKTAGESLAAEIYHRLHQELGNCLIRVALQETKKNRFIATKGCRP